MVKQNKPHAEFMERRSGGRRSMDDIRLAISEFKLQLALLERDSNTQSVSVEALRELTDKLVDKVQKNTAALYKADKDLSSRINKWMASIVGALGGGIITIIYLLVSHSIEK